MIELTLAAVVFVVSHMVLSHGAVRRGLVGKLGLWPHRVVYSLISVAALNWLVQAYRQAPFHKLFDPPIALSHMPLSMMMIASLLIIGGYTIANPSSVVLEDLKSDASIAPILKITRAPVMWGVAFFTVSHMLANPHGAALIFFGALSVLAIAGGWHLDQRKLAEGGDKWRKLAAQTSFWPLGAIFSGRTKLTWADISWWRLGLGVALYGVLLASHQGVIGVGAFVLPD